jgi:hypothetical protein
MGQVPFAYSELKMALAVERVAKDVPVTVIRPVPIYRGIEKNRSEKGILYLVICKAEQMPLAIREEATMSKREQMCQSKAIVR